MKNKIVKFLLNKWTLIVAGIVVVAAAGTITALNWTNWFGGQVEETDGKIQIFYNVDRNEYAFKSETFTSSRTPDKDDGYYHVLFINASESGRSVTRRVKDKKIVDEIDKYFVMGLKFDADGFVSGIVPVEELGYELKVRRGYVDAVAEDGSVTYNTSESGKGLVNKINVPAGMVKYDVGGCTGAIGNTITDPLVEGDTIYVLTNEKGNVKYVFLQNRLVVRDIYWNMARKYDSKKKESTRVPEADGYYYFDLAVNGQQIKAKTADIAIVASIDSQAARCFGLEINESGIITEFLSAKKATGGGSFASWYVIDQIDELEVTAHSESTEDIQEGTFSKSCKIFDVSGKNKVPVGTPSSIVVNDKIHGLRNARGQVVVCFIVDKFPEKVKEGYCSHCKQNVTWYKMVDGAHAYKQTVHYIMTEDITDAAQCNFGATSNLIDKGNHSDSVLDLNGHKLSGKKRAIAIQINCSLTIMDSKGGGVITSDSKETADSGMGIWIRDGAKCTLMGGTVDTSKIVNQNTGCAVYVAKGATFNMHGGTIKGGTSVLDYYKDSTTNTWAVDTKGAKKTRGGYGASVYVAANGTSTSQDKVTKIPVNAGVFNMYGGTITGGTAKTNVNGKTAYGGNIYVASKATANLNGGTISGGTAYGIAGNIYGAANSVINLNGANVIGGTAKQNLDANGKPTNGHGGNVYSASVINMKGGVVAEGLATASGGGNFSLNAVGTKLVMTGGTIRDGWSPVEGRGNVYLWNTIGGQVDGKNVYYETPDATKDSKGISKATPAEVFKMTGGTITDTKSAPAGMYGGGVELTTTTTTVKDANGNPKSYRYYDPYITISGNANISGNESSNLKLASGRQVQFVNLSGAKVGVTSTSKFSSKYPSNYASQIFADVEGCSVVEQKGYLLIGQYRYCTACGDNKPFVPFDNSSYIYEGGHYYLSKDINGNGPSNQLLITPEGTTLTGTTVPKSYDGAITVCFDLNGKKFQTREGKRAFVVNPYQTFNLLDTDGNGNTLNTGTVLPVRSANNSGEGAQGYGIWVRTCAKGTMYGGVIDCAMLENNPYAGTAVSTDSNAQFTLNDGCIRNGKTYGKKAKNAPEGTAEKTYGGNVFVNEKAVFIMNGGIVENGVAKCTGDYREAVGGNIYVYPTGRFVMNGGIVRNGTASDGGNICVDFAATANALEINGGVIEGGQAIKLVNDGAYPSGTSNTNGWGGYGGNIYLYGKAVMTDGTIQNGVAEGYGGNIAIRSENGLFDMTGGVVSGGTANLNNDTKKSANIYVYNNDNATLKYSGGTIATNGEEYVLVNKGKYIKNITVKRYCPHCDAQVDFHDYQGGNINESGHYFLSGNVNISSQCTITPAGTNITDNKPTSADGAVEAVFDLNGKTVTTSSGKRAFVVNDYQSFTLIDTDGAGNALETGTIAPVKKSSTTTLCQGFAVWVRPSATFNMYGGTMDLTNVVDNYKNGTGVFLEPGKSTTELTTFNMFGGTITNGASVYGTGTDGKSSGGCGGNVYAQKNCKITMSGGTISNGRVEGSSARGGNVYICENSIFEMTGGVITGGIGKGNNVNTAGSNLNIAGTATFNMSGGTIEGAVWTDKAAKSTISGASVISGGAQHIYLNNENNVAYTFKDLTEGADIKVFLYYSGKVQAGVFYTASSETEAANLAKYIHANNTGYKIVVDGKDLKIVKE